jgi:hypothetical protein
MHLRSKQVQKAIHGLRDTGHLVIVCKPGEIDGLPYSEVQSEVERVIDKMKGEQG